MIDFSSILSESEFSEFGRSRQSRKVKKGEAIFLEGKSPSSVFYLHAGKVKVFTTDAQGREQIIHLAKPGDLMGYRAMLGGDTYSCTGAAMEDTEVWVIPKETFFDLLDRNAAFSHAVIKLLTAELRHAEHHLAGLARKPVKSRLAEVMLLLADTYGFRDDGQTIDVSLTREEIAGLVGTATETTIRLLLSLRDEGFLATEGKKIRLLDVKGLRLLSENA
ncbi:MAG TPA: Crp/Fnr family transcriptional regulator [Bacteroidia bacterium]|nr:Crp/Fnr family transcriptional regulator [Bacteroidia bacterium]